MCRCYIFTRSEDGRRRRRSNQPLARTRGKGKGPIMSAKVFITGTDTGVGKTWLTVRLLEALRAGGLRALAMKPFCCGGTADLEAYEAVQGSELPRAQLNPYYFPEPVAPLVAARKHHRRIPLDEAVHRIDEAAARCDLLLVEGAGGLFVPLGPRYSVAHLIGRLKCPVVVVG